MGIIRTQYPTTVIPGYSNTQEKQDQDFKSYLLTVVEVFKKGIINSLKDYRKILRNRCKLLKNYRNSLLNKQKYLKRKHKKSLKELQENTTKQVMELNQTTQDLKMELETIKKTQRETTLQIEITGMKSGTIDAGISNRIQEM